LNELHRSWWSDITPDNSPIFSRDISTDEIYALELDSTLATLDQVE